MSAFVQSKAANGNSTAPSATFNSAPTQGNLLVAKVFSQSGTAITMTSSGWTALTSVTAGSGGSARAFRMFYKIAGASESSTVTAAAGNSGWVIEIEEYSGIDTASPLLVENAQSTASATTHATPSVTPTAGANGLIVAGGGVRVAAATWSNEQINSSTTGVTERADNANASSPASLCTYDQFVTGFSGSYSGVATSSSSNVGAAGIAIFRNADTPIVGTYSSGNNADWSHTVDAGNNRELVVLVGTHQGTISNVTYGGTSLTKIAGAATAFNECGEVWVMLNPPVGTATVSISMSGGSWKGGVAVNITNAKQTTTITSATANGNSITALVSITPPSDNNLILAVVGTEATPSAGSGLTALTMLQGQSYENSGTEYFQQTTALAKTMSFGLSSGQRWAIAAAVIEFATSVTTTKTQTGVSRITANTTKTQSGKTAIQNTTTKTQSGVSRIQKSATQAQSGISRITASSTKTITGVVNVRNTATKTQTGLSRITATTLKTITALSRITASVLKTIAGVYRIQKSVTQAQAGQSRITASATKTQAGVSRITITSVKTISGQSRITASTTKTQSGASRVQKTVSQTITGVASITSSTVTTTQTNTGKARITATTQRTIAGLARLQKTATQTQVAVSRIQKAVQQAQTGLARVQKAALQTITGITRITATTVKTLSGLSSIQKTVQQTQDGMARVQKSVLQAIGGVTRITRTVTHAIIGVARITNQTAKTQPGKSRITATAIKAQAGQARLTSTTAQVITGVGSVAVTSIKTIQGVTRITNRVHPYRHKTRPYTTRTSPYGKQKPYTPF